MIQRMSVHPTAVNAISTISGNCTRFLLAILLYARYSVKPKKGVNKIDASESVKVYPIIIE